MRLVHGWSLPDVDRFMATELKPDGTYQGSHLTAAMIHVTDRSIALDGGAHIGTWSKILSGLFQTVVAIEPSPDTFESLQTNMQAFGCTNVELHHAALGKEPGFVSMTWDARAAELANTGGRYVQDGGEIPRITIDSLALPSLGFLKLDVEGAEVDALEGARETLTRCQPIVLFENKGFCRRFGYHKDGPQRLLRSLGYREICAVGKDVIWTAR